MSDGGGDSWYKNWIADWDGEVDTDESQSEDDEGHRFGDIVNIVKIYCKDWQDSPLDIAAFFFCLAAYHKPLNPKENVIYEQDILEIGYHYSRFAFAAYKPSKDLVLKNLRFLEPKDFIIGQWDKEILGKAPAYYIAIDHDENNVILAFRGTKTTTEILTDLAARFIEWDEGFAHLGFVNSLEDAKKLVRDTIIELMEKWEPKGYRLRIVGHSMGAAVAALMVIQWTKEFPSWDIHGYGYATPCCISGHLEEKSKGIFTTFVHHFDAVTRLSMGSIEDLHNGMRMFVEKLGDDSRLLAVVRSIKSNISDDQKKVLKVAEQVDELIQKNLDTEIESMQNSLEVSHLFPAGTTYQLWREKRGNNFVTWQMYKSTFVDYGRLNFSPSMLKDHGTGGYKDAFENMLAITVVEKQLWYSLRKAKRKKISEYWDTHSHDDAFDPNYSTDIIKKCLSDDSKYKKKAKRKGLIRPFLFLVSMSPKRRAALAYLMGMNFVHKRWYEKFSPHRESWYLLAKKGKGLKDRGNLTAHSLHEGFTYMKSAVKQTFSGHPGAINMLTKNNNWYMILYSCSMKVGSMQAEFLPDDTKELLKGLDIQDRKTFEYCKEPYNEKVNDVEQTLLYLFFTLISKEVGKDEDEDEDEGDGSRSDNSHTKKENTDSAEDQKQHAGDSQSSHDKSEDMSQNYTKEAKQTEGEDKQSNSRDDEEKSEQRGDKDKDGMGEDTKDSSMDNETDDILADSDNIHSHSENDSDSGDPGVNRNTRDTKLDKKEEDKSFTLDYDKVVKNLKNHHFTHDSLVELIAEQCEKDAANKKANEVYSWGDVLRRESDKWRKRDVVGVGALAGISAGLLAVGVPTTIVAPPIGLVPLSAAFAILGITISRAKAGGLIPIVAGCLQQRIALAFHDIVIDDYYTKESEIQEGGSVFDEHGNDDDQAEEESEDSCFIDDEDSTEPEDIRE